MLTRLVLIVAVTIGAFALDDRPWMNPQQDPAGRAKALLAKMQTAEKLTMVHGSGGGYVGNVPANSRLGIPALNLNDGPQGFRGKSGTSTAWPCSLCMAASFDRDLSLQWGTAMGKEFHDKGSNVQLGPGICVARVPVNGRNFEYISGEDPTLGAQMVAGIIKGIQSQGVVANAKHWVQNNQETNRGDVSENVDERTRFEIYYPPFKGAIDAGVGSVMCSYNKINNVWSCENNQTLGIDLKERLGYNGWVMSDWGATHSMLPSVHAGLDQEMPGGSFFGNSLATAVSNGQVSIADIDAKVLRILTPMFAVGLFDHPQTGDINANVTSEAHAQLARKIASNAAVLVKNNGILPIQKQKIAVVTGNFPVIGGGSGYVAPPHVISGCQGVTLKVDGHLPPRALNCSYDAGYDYYQPGNPSVPASSREECCRACTDHDDCLFFTFQSSTGTCWLKPSNDGRRPDGGLVSGKCAPPAPGGGNVTCVGSDRAAAVAAAKAADVAIVYVGTSSSEGGDRGTLGLGNGQDDLVTAVAAANPKTIVVVSTPGAVLLPWADSVAAILVNFMPGQEAGNSIADVLFGDVNPSGRLPVTMPNKDNEVGFTPNQYPGVNKQADYTEKLLIGYRWYNQHQVTPRYPFGHGLSYTSFEYSNLQVNGKSVSFTLKNSGSRTGAEIAQLYLGYPASAGEPPKVLRDFQKVVLDAGQSTTVHFATQTPKDLSIWDVNKHDWAPVSGTFEVFVGSSSADIKLKGTMDN